ncbi:MAG: hypothetical protein HYT64_01695 [Candidatus Yanofskybacteria bacterium]|nr:hypothetical protein [Candidatus Yanofskybacteria bacterium]
MNILSKILNTVKHYQKDIFLGVCIVLISIIGFNLGRINATNKTPPAIGEGSRWKVESSNQKANLTKTIDNSQSSTFNSQKSDPRVVASKASSSKKYHYSWCASGKR